MNEASFEEIRRKIHGDILVGPFNFNRSKGNWGDKEFVDGIMEEAEEAGVLNHSFFVLSDKEVRDQFNSWYPEATLTFLGNALENVEEDMKELKK